jgi:hypothetical protein
MKRTILARRYIDDSIQTMGILLIAVLPLR